MEFFLNTLSLGEVNTSALITPYTMAGDTNISNPSKKASNIALLLQNFDSNRSNGNIIDISKFKDLGVYDLSYIDLNSTTDAIETEITELLATGGFHQYIDDTNLTLVNTATANSAMKSFVVQFAEPSILDGFGSQWIEGKTLYLVKYSEHASAWEKVKLTFDTLAKGSTSNNLTIVEEEETEQATWFMGEIFGGTESKSGDLRTGEVHDGTPHYMTYKITDIDDGLYTTKAASSDNKWHSYDSYDDNPAYFTLSESKATEMLNSK